MKKIRINMLSYADKVEGQGVNTVYSELMELLKDNELLDIYVNKGLKYDIMHAHTIDPISYMKQRLSKGKSLTHVHFLPNTLEGAIKAPKIFMNLYKKFIKKAYMKSDYLVVVNPDFIDIFSKWGFNKNNIEFIPNFASPDIFYKMNKKDIQKYKVEYGYNKEDFIVVGVGQLHKGKGVLDFIECAKNNPDIKFIWIGGFNFGKFMEGYKEIKEIYDNPYSNLKFTGIIEREEVNKVLNISDVFFSPSYAEAFSLVIIEACNVEKPIILRDIDVHKNIYFDNYLKGKNVKEFSKLINSLKKNKDLYKEYSKKSVNIKNTYNKESILNKWINLYKKM